MFDWQTLFGSFGMIGGLVAFVLLITWAILLFLLPFFVYGAWQRAKECSLKLERLIQLQTPARPEAAPAAAPDGWS